jgi:uncharacterized protein (TIGR02145 family)
VIYSLVFEFRHGKPYLFIKYLVCALLFFTGNAVAQEVYSGSVVRVGDVEWMAENLAVDHYWDGSPIPEAKTPAQWKMFNERKLGCYCKYDNEGNYEKMYGKLYNLYAIKRGVAPRCWHMPSRTEFDNLVSVGGGTIPGKKLKATHSWNNDWSGTNESGFGAFAAGCRNPNCTFSYVGREAFWWRRFAKDR